MTPKENLIAARKLIERPEYWAHGFSAGWRGVRCALTAIDAAANGEDSRHAAMRLLMAACGGPIIPFNDAPGRKHSEVLAVFDKAIAATA